MSAVWNALEARKKDGKSKSDSTVIKGGMGNCSWDVKYEKNNSLKKEILESIILKSYNQSHLTSAPRNVRFEWKDGSVG